MRRYSAWRESPSSAAAWLMTPRAFESADSIIARSGSAAGAATAVAVADGGEAKILGRDDVVLAEQRRALDRVLELAHVAGPGMCDERGARAFVEHRAVPSRKCSASGRMSSRRSASGGRRSSITLRR